ADRADFAYISLGRDDYSHDDRSMDVRGLGNGRSLGLLFHRNQMHVISRLKLRWQQSRHSLRWGRELCIVDFGKRLQRGYLFAKHRQVTRPDVDLPGYEFAVHGDDVVEHHHIAINERLQPNRRGAFLKAKHRVNKPGFFSNAVQSYRAIVRVFHLEFQDPPNHFVDCLWRRDGMSYKPFEHRIRERRRGIISGHQQFFVRLIANLVEAAARVTDLVFFRTSPPFFKHAFVLWLSACIERLIVGLQMPRLHAVAAQSIQTGCLRHQFFGVDWNSWSGSRGNQRRFGLGGRGGMSLRKSRQQTKNQNQRKRTGKNPKNHRAEFSAVATSYKAISARRFPGPWSLVPDPRSLVPGPLHLSHGVDDVDRGPHFHRLPIQRVRLVLPCLHRVQCGLPQLLRTTDGLDISNVSSRCDRCFQNNSPLNGFRIGQRRVDRNFSSRPASPFYL